MSINEILSIFYPVLYAFLVGFLGFLSKEVLKVIPKVIEFIVAKIGLTNYQKIQIFGKDAWNQIEEWSRLNPIVGDTIKAKQTMFTAKMKLKVPGITDAMIEDVRQAIAGEFNKDKPAVIHAIEQPVEAIPAVVKYFSPDGIELQPVNNTNTQ